ncbi:MAG: thioesterase domain-containing protein [Pseudomonadota bacterium]|nr:thioesterase domain-containing protein [Pseudomonadota bacterium]
MNFNDNKKRFVSIQLERPMSQIRLFCFPYAGGGSSIYRNWSNSVPDSIEIAAVQLPGREWRIEEPLMSSINALANDALEGISSYLDKPFALLGTSMGGTLIFELARRLREEGLPEPLCLVPCACGAPHLPEPEPLHKMSDKNLLAEIREYGAMPEEIQQHPELEEMLLPLIREDCKAHETYVCDHNIPFDYPIWVYGGLYDKTFERTRLDAWSEHTNAKCQTHMVDGGHLFVDSMPDLFLGSLCRKLLSTLENK